MTGTEGAVEHGGDASAARRDRYDAALLRLARDECLYRGDLDEALPRIAESAAEALDVARVGVWFFEDDTLRCVEQYRRDEGSHTSGEELAAENYPAYVEAIRQERQISARDIHEDPRTRELSEPYARPLGIGALLDSPVRLDGEVVGVVCHEEVGGPRDWTESEEHFAASVADYVALALEARELRDTREALRRREERYRAFMEALPVGVIVHQAGEVLYANPEVARVVGVEDPGELVGRSILELIPEEQRERARRRIAEVMEEGATPGPAEYEVLRPDGKEIYVEVTARPVTYRDQEAVQTLVRDITEERRARRRLEESERRFRTLFEENVAGVFRTTTDGRILECNRAFAEMMGFQDPEEMYGREAQEFFESADARDEYLEELREQGSVWNYELRLRRPDGSVLWALENARLEEDGDAGEEVIYGTLVDVTEQRRLREELERMAYHDPLTGLPNRRLLEEHASTALARADRADGSVGMVYLDLARFKRINDTLGHSGGDLVLVRAAERLREALRESDTAARVGGDEFAVLLPDIEGLEGARTAAERIRDRLDRPYRLSGRSFRVSPQMGVAVYPGHGEDFPALFSAADQAMYRAKRGSASRVEVSGPPDELGGEDRLAVEEALGKALEAGRVRPYFQPIYASAGGEPTGAEALVRWDHPERGVLAAADFVHLAERSGRIQELDRSVLAETIRHAARWRETGRLEMVSVNLSAPTFQAPDLVPFLEGRLEAERLEPSVLVLEVTEQVSVRKPELASRVLGELHDLGVRIAIDDFGTGYSSLAYLHRFPADLLKLDVLFVDRLGREGEEERLVEGIIRLGRHLGMQIAAEGVEDERQLEWLRGHGCDFVQGRLLGEPVPPEEF